MSVQRDVLNELRSIAERCHEMIDKINKCEYTEAGLIQLILDIRDDAASEYNSGAIELGWHEDNYDLIDDLNNDK